MLTRRRMLLGGTLLAGASVMRGASPRADQAAVATSKVSPPVTHAAFDVAERMTALPCFGGKELPLWTFQPGNEVPVVRVKAGSSFEARVKNNLPRAGEHITIHWHGLRIPNGEDGVPYMTQTPIMPGEEGRYAFTPPETGTFFFHTHCNSVEHFGRGLFGALIVEGDEVARSDADIVLMTKDWRIGSDGRYLPFSTDEGAAKAGTNGTVRSINGVTKPVIVVPASANVRIRLLNVDVTRISEIGFEGADAVIIAVDGNPCTPIPLTSWRFGPASRLDILLRTPLDGSTIRLIDYFSKEPVVLTELTARGKPIRRDRFTATPLRPIPYAKANLELAERLTFAFSATATGAGVAALSETNGFEIGKLCLSTRTFWAINKQSWTSVDHKTLGPPLAKLVTGKSYIFELQNLTPHSHPIHIHGHTFEVLKSSLRKLPRFRADTVLLLPKERMEVAFVGGQPGKWMFHCHILEHQETGMMGYFDIS
ncbi:MAG: multicopper oxidase family protein [Hyphomicrobium sp.]